MSAIAGRVLLMPKGDYNPLATYNPLDFVTHGANSYVCKQTTTGNAPTNTTYWQLLAQGATDADNINFDNTSSGLSATNTQDAIDEVVGEVGDVNDAISAITNVYSAKNLLPNEAVSASYYGGTFTPNTDGSIVVSGTTATADIYFPILATATSKWYPQTGSYLLSGGNATAKIRLDAYNGNTYVKTLGISPSYESVTVDYDGYDHVRPFVFVGNGTDLSTSVTVYPMLRDSRIPDATYVPFCPTNRQLLSFKDNGVVGAKNLLENKAVSQTVNGVTFTVNADKSISTSGTASTTFQFGINVSVNYYNPKSFYPYYGGNILNGCTGGSDSTYFLYIDYSEDGVTWGGHAVATDGDVLIESNHAYYSQCAIYINSGTNMDGKTFKPMIRLATDTDPTYQPFAMTNRELTEAVQSSVSAVGSIPTGLLYVQNELTKFGKVVEININLINNDANYIFTNGDILGVLPVGYRPKSVTYATLFNRAHTNAVAIYISETGYIICYESGTMPQGDFFYGSITLVTA